MAFFVFLLAPAGGAAQSTEPAPAWFVEEAVVRGLDFVHRSGQTADRYLFPEIHAGGAALFDADGDGDLDAYLVQGGSLVEPPSRRPPNRLYLNDGKGRFRDATEGSGAGHRGYGMGVATGDYDGDGRVDLYVTNVGPNVLLRNLGDGRFADVTARAGVGADGWGSSAAFVDYDRDGDLDLFTLRYLHWTVEGEVECLNATGEIDYCGPAKYDAPAPDILYRNEGDGTFRDVTAELGLGNASATGLGVVTGDFNQDSRADLFVANDNMLDQLWLQQPDGSFRDEAVFWGAAADAGGVPKAGMGVAAADVDDDGDLDLVVCNLGGETDSLFVNQGGYFADRTGPTGLAALSRALTRFGMAWADFDNDGRLDLYQANGKIARQGQRYDPTDLYAEPNLLLRGLPGPRYQEVSPRGGTAKPIVETSRAAAFGDVDGDGGLDVLVVNRDAPVTLLLNRVPDRGHWLRLRILDALGAPALGAIVEVTFDRRRVRREVRTAYSYQSANEATIHLGLGDAEGVSSITVTWPDGSSECFGTRQKNQEIVLRPEGGSPCADDGASPEAG